MNYDVKFSYDGIDGLVGTLATNLEEVTAAHKKASEAAVTAINAVGGESNDIGKAVNNAITSDTQSQLDEAIAIVNNLMDAMTKVKTTYSTQKEDILAAINKAKSGEASSGGNINLGSPSTSMINRTI